MAPDQAWPLSKRAARQAHEFDSAGSPFFLWNLLLPFGLSRELQGRRTSMTLSLKSFRLVDSSSSNWDRSSSSWSLLGPSFGPGSTAIALDQSRSRPKRAARQAHEFDSAGSPFFLWNLLLPFGLSRELQGRRTSMTLSLKSFLPVGHLGLHMNLANATRSRSQGDWSTLGLLLQNGICMSGLPVSSISSGLY